MGKTQITAEPGMERGVQESHERLTELLASLQAG